MENLMLAAMPVTPIAFFVGILALVTAFAF
jgi:hypothetical protein